MCTGIEIALIVGTAVSTVGAISQGIAEKKQAKKQSAILSQQAQQERIAAGASAEDFRRQQARIMAARRAAMGASGVVQTQGSPLLASEDFESEVEVQARRIRMGGDIRATRLEQQAGMEMSRGRAAQTAGYLRGGSLLLSGAGRTYGTSSGSSSSYKPTSYTPSLKQSFS
jgi:hypothetical protein